MEMMFFEKSRYENGNFIVNCDISELYKKKSIFNILAWTFENLEKLFEKCSKIGYA